MRRHMPLPRTASVVIIGGGVVGCSIACHLAGRGVRDVVVLERETVGSGTTSKAAGGIRAQFPTETEIRFSLEAIEVFERFEEEFGVDPGYKKIGYLFLVSDPDDLRGFEPRIALQRRLGVDVRVIAPADAKKLVPALRVDDLVAAVWGPGDGLAGPAEVTNGFARRARERGVKLAEGVRVTAIERAGDRVTGVTTTDGAVSAPLVINAAGPVGATVGRLAGGSAGGRGRTPGGRRDPRAAAPSPHLLHRALPRDPRAHPAHHRPRERLLLPQGDGAGAAEPGRRRGHRRGLRGADGLAPSRRGGGQGGAPRPRAGIGEDRRRLGGAAAAHPRRSRDHRLGARRAGLLPRRRLRRPRLPALARHRPSRRRLDRRRQAVDGPVALRPRPL